MRRDKFEALVQQALLTIPARFRRRIRNLAIIVEDEPDAQLLADMDVPDGETLFGLYHGVPLTERGWDYGNRLPDRITVFQGPHEREYDEDELVTAIGETLIHEIGHYFGMSEEEIEEIEEHYWREQSGEDDGQDDEDDQGQDGEDDDETGGKGD
jgi:predicted Zn-dependent protease with MMP-like domain